MSATPASLDSGLTSQVLRYALVYAVIRLYVRGSQTQNASLIVVSILSVITLAGRQWLWFISKYVPEPYLDEVFHIPQAQVYCDGRYGEWDEKITTPPGLYLSTILFNRLFWLSCSVHNLRSFNVDIISYLAVAAMICRARFEQPQTRTRSLNTRYSSYAIGTGVNIALFPGLFFFSGLYYTDPISTLAVLLAYSNHVARAGKEKTSLGNDLYTLGLGILTLCMRQTNIFWVVVYMGSLEVVHGIKTLKPEPVEAPVLKTLPDQLKFYARRYSLGDIHDPALDLASPIDIVLCIASIGIAAACNLTLVVRRFVWPHGAVLTAFVAFVVWNGGVVLGDKPNHVATLHLAQMLYIWPLFAFFSAPLLITPIFHSITQVYRGLMSSATTPAGEQGRGKGSDDQSDSAGKQSATLKACNYFGSIPAIHSIIVLIGALAIAALIVKFNTIIHPFTLADNRHYMFYVFRYSILRAWWIRYALLPVYVACAWMCWTALQGGPVASPDGAQGRRQWHQSPFTKASSKVSPASSKKQSKEGRSGIPTPEPGASATTAPPTSTVLLLLLATTLSLMTAPLVEPRYFILPWVFWRLLVPAWPVSESTASCKETATPDTPRISLGRKLLSTRIDPRLVLETAWFLLINAGTMYIFLTRPFYWKTPDGALLDDGRVQRFMW